MKKRPNATPSGPAGHSRQAFQGGTYSLMLTAAVLALLIVLNLLVSALPTNLTQYDISASKLYSVTSNTKVVVNVLLQRVDHHQGGGQRAGAGRDHLLDRAVRRGGRGD